MSTNVFVSSLVLLTAAGSALAQESAARFDAAVVVADHQKRFQKLGDINGDGYMDAFSAWWADDQYTWVRVSAFINDRTGKLTKTWSTFTSALSSNNV